MNVYLEAIGDLPPWHDQELLLRACAAKDKVGRHSLISDRDSADIILSIFHKDPRFCSIDFDERRFAYCSCDNGFPAFPGIYPSLTPWNAHSAFARSGPYLPKPWDDEGLDFGRTEQRYLYSFVGSALTSPIRQKVLRLRHLRGHVRDSSGDDGYKNEQPAETYQRFHQSFRSILAGSLFVLCPRGAGTSSIRLFETMRAGRVPVVISDDWLPPSGLAWQEFIVWVPEKDIATIPQQLESLEDRALGMGSRARSEWENCFAENRVFDWLIEQILSMRSLTRAANVDFQAWRTRRLLDWKNLRSVSLPWLKHCASRFVGNGHSGADR